MSLSNQEELQAFQNYSPLQELSQTFTKNQIKEALFEMYDAFIRDSTSGGMCQELRIRVHEVYRALEKGVDGMKPD